MDNILSYFIAEKHFLWGEGGKDVAFLTYGLKCFG